MQGLYEAFAGFRGLHFAARVSVKFRAQILSLSLMNPAAALQTSFSLAEKKSPFNVNLPPSFFLCNRAIVLTDHCNNAKQALMACPGKNNKPDRIGRSLTEIILNSKTKLMSELQDRAPHFCEAVESYLSGTHGLILRKILAKCADLR